ncbi:MAG: response regulator [Chitinophagaceae bacterium]|nr:MAG: response regulator [Chitinophagaceae bacterium]
MNKNGPIIIIEDDLDDQEQLDTIFTRLGYTNEVLYFGDGEKALAYISQEGVFPFLILSDINMPRLNGLELKKKIHTDAQLQIKCIPYLFFTTSASKKSVIDAYSMSAQGFFIKETNENELELTIRSIMEYWKRCYSPNQYPY